MQRELNFLRPHPRCLIGELLEESSLSSVLWTPETGRRQGELMRVLSIGSQAHCTLPELQVQDVVVLNFERYGASLHLEDEDTHEKQSYHIVKADDVLAVYREDG